MKSPGAAPFGCVGLFSCTRDSVQDFSLWWRTAGFHETFVLRFGKPRRETLRFKVYCCSVCVCVLSMVLDVGRLPVESTCCHNDNSSRGNNHSLSR